MKLEFLEGKFSICKLPNCEFVNWEKEFLHFSKTDNEISLLCQTEATPVNAINAEHGYVGFRVKGSLDFALTGILSPIAGILAEAAIPIFVVSTYDTDYIFIKEVDVKKAKILLLDNGYSF